MRGRILGRAILLIVLGIIIMLTGAALNWYCNYHLPNQIRQETERIKEDIFGLFENDRLLLNQAYGLSDFDDGVVTPEEKQGLLRLRDNLLNDYQLAYRGVVAGKYLAESSRQFGDSVTGNSTVVNDALEVVLKHRLMNNGTDDPSGFASVPDLVKLMYYRWAQETVGSTNETVVSRMELSDKHVNATMAFADDSWRVLPRIGGYIYREFEDRKEGHYFSYAPYSQTASHDPRFTIAPFWNETGPLHVTTNGTIIGIPWDESYFENVIMQNKGDFPNWDQWYKWWTDAGKPYAYPMLRKWLRSIDIAATEAAKDLEALKNGFLNMTQYRYNYAPMERQSYVQEGDAFLIKKGDFVDSVPISMRPFTQYTSSLHLHFLEMGLSEDIPLLSEMSLGGGAFRNYAEWGLPNPENASFYVTGAQFLLNFDTRKYGGEYFGVMVADSSTTDSRENYADAHNRFQIVDGRLVSVGEPMPIPTAEFPFVSERTGEYYRNSNLYVKYFLLRHNLIDEGNPWLKIVDNTDDLES